MLSVSPNIKMAIVEDDDLTRSGLYQVLKGYGEVQLLSSFEEASAYFDEHEVDLAFVDLHLEGPGLGLDLLRKHKLYSIVLSGCRSPQMIEEAYELGCHDFLIKPMCTQAIEKVIQKHLLYVQGKSHSSRMAEAFGTRHPAFLRELTSLENVLFADLPIFLKGESGTGKSHLAKIIHQHLFLKNEESFLHLNCAALPENLIESELFGYVKGAFSGADKDKLGLLALADEGTLFLDEVGCLSSSTQRKLLKVLEDGEYYPLGSNRKQRSRFRLISASCDPIEKMIEHEVFRRDLYYRLAGKVLTIPSLRERMRDIESLADYFLSLHKRKIVLTRDAYQVLHVHQWPGNVRELKRFVDSLQSHKGGKVTGKDVEKALLLKAKAHESKFETTSWADIQRCGLKPWMKEQEKRIVRFFYEKNKGSTRMTMHDLKLSCSSFYRIFSTLKEEG